MDSKEEKVDMLVNQPLRLDGIVEKVVVPESQEVAESGHEPFMSPPSTSKKSFSSLLSLAAIMSAMKGKLMGGFRPSMATENTDGQPSRSKRKAFIARRKARKAEKFARRLNRGVRGHTQLHHHR